jgi:hypothetical protein
MVHVPVALNMATVALVTPPETLGVPSEHTELLAASTDNATANPEVDCAATGNAL